MEHTWCATTRKGKEVKTAETEAATAEEEVVQACSAELRGCGHAAQNCANSLFAIRRSPELLQKEWIGYEGI